MNFVKTVQLHFSGLLFRKKMAKFADVFNNPGSNFSSVVNYDAVTFLRQAIKNYLHIYLFHPEVKPQCGPEDGVSNIEQVTL